ncbi:MAG: tetratricopeptide repeat protein [candidate division Zixibacteria bacterium]|nr:tetratricopeptide repeat protein [candidate division Zixibacteria bacterium]
MSPPAAFPPGFTFQKELGRGGTATVVLARCHESNRDIALKLPLITQEESFKILARREAHLIGGLRYPGLVRVHNVSLDEMPYVALEPCRGPTLDLIGRVEPLTIAMNVISAMAINLEFLRLKGIIHGDFKPHNVFLPSDWQCSLKDGRGYVKLSDFSLGQLTDESNSVRAGLGTIGYLAPETITAQRTSHRSDLFALGVTAYQVLTGEHPFMTQSSDPVEVNSRCCEENPVPVEKLRPDLTAEISSLINCLLAKDENVRLSSAWEVCCKLQEAGADYPFRQKLKAVHLIHGEKTYAAAVARILNLNDHQRERLDFLTSRSLVDLRLILADNQRSGNLIYDNQRFIFPGGIRWPAWMRRRSLQVFSSSPLSKQRQLVKVAIAGSVHNGRTLELIGPDELLPGDEPTLQLLRQFLSPASWRFYSHKYGLRAESEEEYALAARLYTQAGNLEKAELTAFQAATKFHDQHLSSEALALLKHVLAYADLINESYAARRLLMLQGDILKETGETEEALSVYNTILSLYDNRPPDKLLGETHKDIGDLYKTMQKFEQGLTSLRSALDIYQALNDELEVSRTLNNIGNIYWVGNELVSALDHYRAALKIQRRLGAEVEIASTLSNIGSIYAIQGRLERGIRILHLSLQLKKAIGNTGEIARSLNNLGYCYHVSGQSGRAVDCLTESLELNRRIGSRKEILFNLENLTAVMIMAGQLRESLVYLRDGLSLAASVGDNPHLAAFQLSMATVLRRMGQLGEAAASLSAVEKSIEGIDSDALIIQLGIGRAALRAATGDSDSAIKCAREALDQAAKIKIKPEQLNALLVLIRVSGDDQLVRDALSLADELSLEREKTLIMFGRLEWLLCNSGAARVDDLVAELIPRLESISDDIELAGMYNSIAEYYLNKHKTIDAEKMLERAMKLANASNLVSEKTRTLTLLGRLRYSQNEYEQCYANLKNALGLCRQIADSLTNEQDRCVYQRQQSIQTLVAEVNRLNQRMGQRERTL